MALAMALVAVFRHLREAASSRNASMLAKRSIRRKTRQAITTLLRNRLRAISPGGPRLRAIQARRLMYGAVPVS